MCLPRPEIRLNRMISCWKRIALIHGLTTANPAVAGLQSLANKQQNRESAPLWWSILYFECLTFPPLYQNTWELSVQSNIYDHIQSLSTPAVHLHKNVSVFFGQRLKRNFCVSVYAKKTDQNIAWRVYVSPNFTRICRSFNYRL